MITSTRTGKKTTANQLAKEAIADHLRLIKYFMEPTNFLGNNMYNKMTEKEQGDYHEACNKKIAAILKHLGVDEVGQKVEPSY